jgi:hypothetical protein
MANKQKGEVDLRVGGKVYTLRYSTNALCVLEDAFDDTVQNIAKRFDADGDVRMSDVRRFFHAGLIDNQPEIDISGAGLIISDAGMENAMSAASDAFSLAFAPQPAGAVEPQKGKRRTAG